MSERLSISSIEVQVRRSDRRQTIGLTVERDGSVEHFEVYGRIATIGRPQLLSE